MQIRHQVDVGRPPEVVFDFLTNTDSFRAVDRALVSSTPDGLMELGLSGTFVHRRGGMTVRSTWKVAELERPWRLRVAVRGIGYEMDEAATFVATATGTRATFIDTVRPTSIIGRLMVAMSARIMQRDLSARTALLKSILEGPSERPGLTP